MIYKRVLSIHQGQEMGGTRGRKKIPIIMLCPTLVVNYSDSILSHRIEQQGCKGKPRKEGQGFTMHIRRQHGIKK